MTPTTKPPGMTRSAEVDARKPGFPWTIPPIDRHRPANVDYCGECYQLDPAHPFIIGREGDLVIDENPYLHRHFLSIRFSDSLWWLLNIGSHLSATVIAGNGTFHAKLAPGGHVPLVFGNTAVVFSAGPTTYELSVHCAAPKYVEIDDRFHRSGGATIGIPSLTPSQKVLIVALAEEVLRRDGTGASHIPTSSQAAKRLGWSITKFNRKLDNVCDKFAGIGVQGLRGGAGNMAMNRRARLVEYAMEVRLVGRADLTMLDSDYVGEQ